MKTSSANIRAILIKKRKIHLYAKLNYRIFIISFFLSMGAFAQLTVDTTVSVEDLVDKILVGKGMRVGNIKCTTNKKAIGYFKCNDNKIGIRSGLILSTGLAVNAIGPNTSPGQSSIISLNNKKRKKDKHLSKLAPGKGIFDVSVIEFDFVPLYNKVVFEYSFGSEEYKEYVGSTFNDVFGFFITGPEMKEKNLALLPQDKKFVAINNINHQTNKAYFIDNDPFINNTLFKNVSFKPRLTIWQKIAIPFSKKNEQNGSVLYYTNAFKKATLDTSLLQTFQYDAFTKKLKVIFFATPYEKYHIKIAIGDVADPIFDSGVFLEEKSFISYKDTLDPNYLKIVNKKALTNFDSIFGINKTVPVVEDKNEENTEEYENTIVNFDVSSHIIPDSCRKKLDDLAALMRKQSKFTLNITGYTDNTGNKKRNKELSEKRATAIMYYLTEHGVERIRLNYLGQSSENPVADNKTEQGKALNRRVEIEIVE